MSTSQPAEQELRYELKLTCAAHWLPQARMWLRLHPEGFRIEHASRQVNNLYLDTPDLDHFRTNLAGLSERRKLRLRWYGELAPSGPAGQIPVQPILELKHKTNMLGGKKQFILPALLDLAQPWAEILVSVRQALPPEWRPWLEEADRPTLVNSYYREYYITVDGGLRATLDYSQRAYDQRLSLRPNLTTPLPIDDLVVIEIKADITQEDRLLDVATYFPIPRTRNSKYANALAAAVYSQ